MEKRARKSFLEQEVVEYVFQVKAYLQQDGRSFKEFSDIIGEAKKRKVDSVTLRAKLNELFKERKDLILGFNSFIPDELKFDADGHGGSEHISFSVGEEDLLHDRCYRFEKIQNDHKESSLAEGSADGHSDDDRNNMEKVRTQVLELFEEVRSSFGHEDEYLKFLKLVHHYNSKQIGLNDLLRSILEKYPHLRDEFEQLSRNMEKLNKVENKKRKIMDKSIHELDFSDCQRCTPSYWRLPKELVVSKSSHRSDLDSEVLNDEWVSRAPPSMNFKHRRLTKYEKALNECEDDRYEADMMVHSLESMAKRIEDLLDDKDIIKIKTPFNVKEHISFLNLKVVERIYGERGLRVMDELSENPYVSMPVVLSELKNKLGEFENDRADCDQKWASVNAKCHKKLQRKEC